MRLVLVYQAGIANIFQLQSDNSKKRLLQASFRECEWFMRGAQHAGASVDVAACNMAGDSIGQPWSRDLDNHPFSDQFGCKWMQRKEAA
jgi:hypothetical protein